VPESPLYRPIAEHLPAVYQEDIQSWDELTGYLALVDALYRAYVAELEDVTSWLSPAAANVQPPGLRAAGGGGERELALLDELASWFGFAFPGSWRPAEDEASLDALRAKERAFVLRAARLFRRRGTPQGFVDWFCFAFDIVEPDERPVLLEHFKYRPGGDTHGSAPPDPLDPDPFALRVTLLVPRTDAFDDYRRRREAAEFVRQWLPAHLLGVLCWVDPEVDWQPTNAAQMRNVLDRLAGYTPEEDGLHLRGEAVDPIPPNRLGQGRLPGTGVRPEE
jgi:hypothetical protein